MATARRHTNVLQHRAGYFKDRIDAASKRELADTLTKNANSQDFPRAEAVTASRVAVVEGVTRLKILPSGSSNHAVFIGPAT